MKTCFFVCLLTLIIQGNHAYVCGDMQCITVNINKTLTITDYALTVSDKVEIKPLKEK